MKQLEVRFYSLDELAEAIDRKRDRHFAGNAKADLTKWGYEWEWKNGRGVLITKAPQTAKERLAEIMNRKFGLDIQVDGMRRGSGYVRFQKSQRLFLLDLRRFAGCAGVGCQNEEKSDKEYSA